jgi:hypothetical protein
VAPHLMRRPAALLACICFGAAPAQASAETLYGSIQGGNIALRHADGAMVSQILPGPYTFEVTDNELIHNFHLLGTTVRTPVDASTGTYTFANVALAAGSYTYRCDIHPEVHGSFGVNQPPPPSTPPATVTRIRALKVRGERVVVVSLAVTRAARATAHLRRSGRMVAGTRRTFQPGSRALRIVVPARARGGVYYVRLTLQESGRTFVTTRVVRVPRR